MRNILLALFVFLASSVSAKDYLILQSRDAGMFSIFMDVLAICQVYEQGKLNGIEVDFGTTGQYYSKDHGPNWWEYYCEPIKYGTKKHVRTAVYHMDYFCPGQIEFNISRKDAKRLIDFYIRPKAEIMYCVDKFIEKHFKEHYVICVHYRGTDKYLEAPIVPYNDVVNYIEAVANTKGDPDYKIFVATDEINFLNFMILKYGDKVCYQEAHRVTGNTGLHNLSLNRYEIGREALIDMILLSKGNHLIRSSSNLSKWSSWWNPEIKETELNWRHGF